MREVKYVTHGYFGVECKNVGPIKDGLFHGFFQEGSNENGMEAVAIIETTIGECLSVGARQIKFINPPKSEQGDSKNSSQAVQQTQPIIPLPEECVFVPMADKLGIDINLAAKLYDAVVAKQQADG